MRYADGWLDALMYEIWLDMFRRLLGRHTLPWSGR